MTIENRAIAPCNVGEKKCEASEQKNKIKQYRPLLIIPQMKKVKIEKEDRLEQASKDLDACKIMINLPKRVSNFVSSNFSNFGFTTLNNFGYKIKRKLLF